ncbi:unnamed protein product [Hydatigera taeniaeformis]|uniref:Effector from type III secretion system family protein n=1 Tax=Hydatigena taeniaeformis TaxID=6205 RepID=A0A0R3WSV8_HYDTA|nr:unnamed protein product [Hydatigera taeniaeformis]
MAPKLIQSTNEFQIGISDVVNAAKNSSSVDLVAQKERFDAVFDAGLSDFQRDFINNSSAAAAVRAKEALQQVVYKFSAGSADSTAMKDFLETLEKTSVELPFIRSTISDVLNSECTVDQLSTCRGLLFTTDNDLKLTYTLEQFQSSQVANLLTTLESNQQNVKNLDNFTETLLRMKEDVKKTIQPILDEIVKVITNSASSNLAIIIGWLTLTNSFIEVIYTQCPSDAWNDLSNSPKTRENLVKSLELVAETARSFLAKFNDIIANYISSDSSYVA